MIGNDQDFIAEVRRDFLEETTFLLDQCEESYLNLEKPEGRSEELGKIFRLAHSMKGAGAAVGFLDLSGFAHVVEDCLTLLRVHPELVTSEVISLLLRCGDAFRVRVKMLKEGSAEPWDVSALHDEIVAMTKRLTEQGQGAELTGVHGFEPGHSQTSVSAAGAETGTHQKARAGSVKIDIDRIESVLDMVGELVVLKSQLTTETLAYQTNLKLNVLVALIEKSIRDLQDRALGMRMTPLKSLFLKTQRIVRDLSLKLGKQVEFIMEGEETEIDRTMVELLADPLMHIARNALDHGVEKEETRLERGKPAKGTIRMSAQQVGRRVLLKITDDGAGIHRERVLKRAVERGLLSADAKLNELDDQSVYQFIFAPGFSTAEVVSEVSGRGVGMDVVKTNIERMSGTVEIKSTPGSGTSFIISIPLTTSITDGMQVKSGGQDYILPLNEIRELVDFNASSITRLHTGQEVLAVRGQLLPILDLDQVLYGQRARQRQDQAEANSVVVVEGTHGLVALRVQSVIGQVQVVLKALGDYFTASRGIAGGAILGDGKIALVLDIDALHSEKGTA